MRPGETRHTDSTSSEGELITEGNSSSSGVLVSQENLAVKAAMPFVLGF